MPVIEAPTHAEAAILFTLLQLKLKNAFRLIAKPPEIIRMLTASSTMKFIMNPETNQNILQKISSNVPRI